MSKSLANVILRVDPDDVKPYIDTARQFADREAAALGFIPQAAYKEAAVQGKLWIAVASEDGNEEYVGHLLFGGAFPKVRVFQLFVKHDRRGMGVASALVSRLVEESEAQNYLSISARVADDLEANSFWERKGFTVAGCEPGGASTKRIILQRERRLSTPTLFDLLNASATPTDHDLRLADRLYSRSPHYTIDVNVLLDLLKDRPRAADVRRLFSAAMAGAIQLKVAPEFVVELQKSSSKTLGEDSILQFAISLPQFPAPPSSQLKGLLLELGAVVFPEKTRQQRLKPRDESDLMHLATAIHHGVEGFITSEKGILRCRRFFRQRYGLDVVGVQELAEQLTPCQWAEPNHLTAGSFKGGEITAKELKENERRIAEEFLRTLRVERRLQTDALDSGHTGSPRRRLLISTSEHAVAYASWDAPSKVTPRVEAFLFADEDQTSAESAIEYALFLLTKDASRLGPSLVCIWLKEASFAGQLAISIGFRQSSTANSHDFVLFQKICLGKIIDERNWGDVRAQIATLAKVELQPIPPPYLGLTTPISVRSPQGAALCVPVAELEELIGPTLMVLPNRTAAVVPIRRKYAEQLLGTSAQEHLFAKYEASLLSRRAYFSAIAALRSLAPGTVMLFYESREEGGRGAIVACARSVENAVQSPKEVSESLKRRGVLEDAPIQRIGRRGKTGITVFDTVMTFTNPVPLARLRKIGVDRNNFMTSLRISYAQLVTILAEGQAHV